MLIEKKHLSVGFADLDNWIGLIELIGEKFAIECLLKKFKEIETIIHHHGGRIRKYIGDSLLFSFENSSGAVSAGKQISALSIKENGGEFFFFVGIATGTVYEVDLGQIEKDIYGKTVNDAALLTKKSKLNQNRIELCPQTKLGL